mmetsp:Transcript_11224/g.33213  ORF Transcript_11224/g.33213 Transcript_11224/m.33213 type:complete len:304 (+) Transcript_11224:179-1090(+)
MMRLPGGMRGGPSPKGSFGWPTRATRAGQKASIRSWREASRRGEVLRESNGSLGSRHGEERVQVEGVQGQRLVNRRAACILLADLAPCGREMCRIVEKMHGVLLGGNLALEHDELGESVCKRHLLQVKSIPTKGTGIRRCVWHADRRGLFINTMVDEGDAGGRRSGRREHEATVRSRDSAGLLNGLVVIVTPAVPLDQRVMPVLDRRAGASGQEPFHQLEVAACARHLFEDQAVFVRSPRTLAETWLKAVVPTLAALPLLARANFRRDAIPSAGAEAVDGGYEEGIFVTRPTAALGLHFVRDV